MENKLSVFLSILLGLFFLFSLFSKILSVGDWLNFNYELVDSKLGYFNGIIILIVELFYGISFVFLKINKKLILSCFIFILFLTLVVLLNKDLFQSCMCFGKLITIKPDIHFIIKNSVLLFIILIIYLLHKKVSIIKPHTNEKN
jgi:hypothetical protein